MQKRKALLGGGPLDSLSSTNRIGRIALTRFSVETRFQGRGLMRI